MIRRLVRRLIAPAVRWALAADYRVGFGVGTRADRVELFVTGPFGEEHAWQYTPAHARDVARALLRCACVAEDSLPPAGDDPDAAELRW